jgi:hypothetical protein
VLRGLSRKNGWYLLWLAFAFVSAFALPVVFAFSFNGLWSTARKSEGKEGALFAGAFAVRAAGKHLRVPASPDLDPGEGVDFLLTGWFQLAALPEEGQRIVLLQKYDRASAGKEGYALALKKQAYQVIPEVYWKDSGDTGRWFSFSEIKIAPMDWFMLALSFDGERVLGLHGAVATGVKHPRAQVLGGYNLEPPVMPKSEADMVVGAAGPGKFRGWVGPFGVFAKKKLSRHLDEVYQSLLERPLAPPPYFSGKETLLWCSDGKKDQSEFGRAIALVREHGKKGKKLGALSEGAPREREQE